MLACFLRPGVISCDLAAALLADHPCTGCAYVCFFFICSFHNCSNDSWIWILYYLHVLHCDVCGSLNFCWYIPKVAPVTGFTREVIHCWGLLHKVRPFLQACTCLSTRKQRISTLIWYPISIFRFILYIYTILYTDRQMYRKIDDILYNILYTNNCI